MGCDFRVSLEGPCELVYVCMILQGGRWWLSGEGGDDGNRENNCRTTGRRREFRGRRTSTLECDKKDEDEEGKALDFLFRPPGGLWAAATKACVRWTGRAKWAWASGGKAPRADCSGGAFV